MASVDRIFRVMVAIGGGWLALRLIGSLNWLFAALAFGLIVYGVALTAAITSAAWFGRDSAFEASPYSCDAEKGCARGNTPNVENLA
jgi:hypothetical protein